MDEFLTAKEAAELLGVKPATLYAYVSRGIVRSYRPGLKRRRLYRRAELEVLIGRGTGQPLRPHRIPLAQEWMPYV
ncbi:MAG TPA: helix-turn-helix domain-containing protein [Chloroflexota bacterium]